MLIVPACAVPSLLPEEIRTEPLASLPLPGVICTDPAALAASPVPIVTSPEAPVTARPERTIIAPESP